MRMTRQYWEEGNDDDGDGDGDDSDDGDDDDDDDNVAIWKRKTSFP